VQVRDRRPALAALALLLVLLGALGAALIVYRSGARTDVLVAAHEIEPGQQVSSSDFTTIRISKDSAAAVAPASVESSYIGTYATTRIPAGTLINGLMFRATGVIPSDGVVVGITLGQQARPASPINVGDVVRAYAIPKPGPNGQVGPATVIISAARVVAVTSGSTSGSLTVSLLVTTKAAPQLVSAAAQNDVSLTALPVGTTPTIDYVTGS
jgi:hypothetical protein